MIGRDEMSSNDTHLRQLLTQLAPPAQDPLFRVRVMERKQREWLRRQVIRTAGVLGVGILAATVGTALSGDGNEVPRIVGLGVALGAGLTVYAFALRSLVRRW
jgi:hypothetical protein